jgi:DGQHR domain-containing protein
VRTLTYRGVSARQSPEHRVITIVANASDVLTFARIDRAGRGTSGTLTGFQRPQVASHIREIREYLKGDDAVLPNPIVVAFVDHVSVRDCAEGFTDLTIDIPDQPAGFIVDGQQRLTALADLQGKDFEVFVSVLICRNYEELRRQFVLINNTRPLPKALIYELLPGISGLPWRLTKRSYAAALTERLNFDEDSSLKGLIYQHTNPSGVLRDTAIQRVIMQSMSDGAIREIARENQIQSGFELISNFFTAVKTVFAADWDGHSATTSRLMHGAGIVAMGYVMELLAARDGAFSSEQFVRGLGALRGKTAWTSGSWRFSRTERVPWKAVENTPRQILALAQHLVSLVRRHRLRSGKRLRNRPSKRA